MSSKRSYESRMMNVGVDANATTDTYHIGHRDARHACAEIALEADATIAALRERVADLEGVMGKLPVTADGVPVVPGRDRVYCIFADKPRSSSLVWGDEDGWRTSNYWKPLSEVYSTPQAAQAAAEQQP